MPAVRILHVITGLGTGGAEMMLYKLISASRPEGHSHSVVSLMNGGGVRSLLERDGIRVSSLGMHQGMPNPLAVVHLALMIRRERPDIVQSWMYHADLLAAVAGAAARVPVVWGIHHSDVDPRTAKRLTHWTRLLCARVSGVLPARIICGAESVSRSHVPLGYREDRIRVIPIGFDLERFAPDAPARARVRRDLSIADDAPVVGLLARFHPDKDHANFFEAARQVARELPEAVFLLTGGGIVASNAGLRKLIDRHGLASRVRLLGVVPEVRDVLSAIDVLALSSRAEAFPNVLGEAMACGVPCAATDCGDAREIVGATGRVVPPRDSAALAGAILELLRLPTEARATLGRAARERIRERYEIRHVAQRYIALYSDVCGGRRGSQSGGGKA